MGCRCFWDADTDNYADESYRNVRGCRSRAARAASARPPHASACPGAAGAPLTDELFRARRTRSFASRPPSGCTCTKRKSHALHRISRQSLPLARPSVSPARGDSVVFPTSRHCVPHPRACCSFTMKLLSGAKSDRIHTSLKSYPGTRPVDARSPGAASLLSRLPDGTLCTLETGQTTDAVTALSRVRDQGPREDVGTGRHADALTTVTLHRVRESG